MKRCVRCHLIKVASSFRKNLGNADKLYAWCKECQNVYNRNYYSIPKNYQRRLAWFRRRNADPEFKKKRQEYQKKHEQKPLIKKARQAQRKRYHASQKGRFNNIKNGALHRGIKWLLTFEQVMKFWKRPCSYCGGPISTIGLDRFDSTKPYEIDNIVACCY